jgi:hypothetical protein
MSTNGDSRCITSNVLRATLLLIVVATALTLRGGVLGTSSAWASDTFAVVDTLGAATPTTTFSVFGSSGNSIFGSQLVGPKFELAQPTVITEIGAFLNNCESIVGGVPQCPGTLPFIVQIRPSLDGMPDPSRVLATFVLSHDDDPLLISYESVSADVSLTAGTYFALFVPQHADAGFLLGVASSPFEYLAGTTTLGFLDPASGVSFASEQSAAVRILGRVNSADEQLVELRNFVDGEKLGPGSSLRHKLIAVQQSLAEGHITAACNKLDAFVNHVRAQAEKSLSSTQAGRLTADALQIKDAMGC